MDPDFVPMTPAGFRWRKSGGEWVFCMEAPKRKDVIVRALFTGKQLKKAYAMGVASMTSRPTPPEAIDAEVASWHHVLMLERDANCPDGRAHEIVFIKPSGNDYCTRCTRCNHHSPYPF